MTVEPLDLLATCDGGSAGTSIRVGSSPTARNEVDCLAALLCQLDIRCTIPLQGIVSAAQESGYAIAEGQNATHDCVANRSGQHNLIRAASSPQPKLSTSNMGKTQTTGWPAVTAAAGSTAQMCCQLYDCQGGASWCTLAAGHAGDHSVLKSRVRTTRGTVPRGTQNAHSPAKVKSRGNAESRTGARSRITHGLASTPQADATEEAQCPAEASPCHDDTAGNHDDEQATALEVAPSITAPAASTAEVTSRDTADSGAGAIGLIPHGSRPTALLIAAGELQVGELQGGDETAQPTPFVDEKMPPVQAGSKYPVSASIQTQQAFTRIDDGGCSPPLGSKGSSKPLVPTPVGTVLWAKATGFSYWPAVVVSDEQLPSDARAVREDGSVLVRFYGKGSQLGLARSTLAWEDGQEAAVKDARTHHKKRKKSMRDFELAVGSAEAEMAHQPSAEMCVAQQEVDEAGPAASRTCEGSRSDATEEEHPAEASPCHGETAAKHNDVEATAPEAAPLNADVAGEAVRRAIEENEHDADIVCAACVYSDGEAPVDTHMAEQEADERGPAILRPGEGPRADATEEAQCAAEASPCHDDAAGYHDGEQATALEVAPSLAAPAASTAEVTSRDPADSGAGAIGLIPHGSRPTALLIAADELQGGDEAVQPTEQMCYQLHECQGGVPWCTLPASHAGDHLVLKSRARTARGKVPRDTQNTHSPAKVKSRGNTESRTGARSRITHGLASTPQADATEEAQCPAEASPCHDDTAGNHDDEQATALEVAPSITAPAASTAEVTSRDTADSGAGAIGLIPHGSRPTALLIAAGELQVGELQGGDETAQPTPFVDEKMPPVQAGSKYPVSASIQTQQAFTRIDDGGCSPPLGSKGSSKPLVPTPVGTVLWAKATGFSYWPAVVVSDEQLPSDARAVREDGSVLVRFYGKGSQLGLARSTLAWEDGQEAAVKDARTHHKKRKKSMRALRARCRVRRG